MAFLSLQHSIKWAILIHVLFGAIALLTFAVPLFSKKGGKLHVKAGWIYTYAMLIVAASTFIITPWRIFFDQNRNHETQSFSVFLFFIAVFTLSALHFGLMPLKLKKRSTPSKAFIHIGPPIILIILSLATQMIGIKNSNVLLIVFPLLALTTGKSQLSYWLGAPTSNRHWWYAHMSGMGTACIATVTAFLVTALPRIWPNPIVDSPVLWIAPGIIGGIMLKRSTNRYRAQFD